MRFNSWKHKVNLILKKELGLTLEDFVTFNVKEYAGYPPGVAAVRIINRAKGK